MNRSFPGAALALLVSLSASLIALDGATAPRAQAQDPGVNRGTINIIRPEIYLTQAGEAEGRIGMPTTIQPGERLRTDGTGVALITWLPDGTESVAGPGTQLALERFAGERERGFDVALELSAGQLRMGIGDLGAAGGASAWRVRTPAFEAALAQGRFELRVGEEGQTTLIVTEGSAEITRADGAPLRVAANEFVTARPGDAPAEAQRLSLDGVEVALSGVCTGEARANVNVRLAPSESSRRLGGLIEGQRFWVRAATDGRLWLQIYYRTPEDDPEAHSYGWVYGPIAALDEAQCADLVRAPLDAQIFGGPGIGGGDGESDAATEDAAEDAAAPAETPTATPGG
ncbi:MAG: hypothetical protein AAGU78_14900 [Chloroflexota bacterium]